MPGGQARGLLTSGHDSVSPSPASSGSLGRPNTPVQLVAKEGRLWKALGQEASIISHSTSDRGSTSGPKWGDECATLCSTVRSDSFKAQTLGVLHGFQGLKMVTPIEKANLCAHNIDF